MTSSHGRSGNGPDALPVITTRIEMIDPATITRASLPDHRGQQDRQPHPTPSPAAATTTDRQHLPTAFKILLTANGCTATTQPRSWRERNIPWEAAILGGFDQRRRVGSIAAVAAATASKVGLA
jgi:hypothetical protein